MSTSPYDDVLNQARQLELADQVRLIRELSALIQRRIAGESARSIRELRGLGKEIWAGTDAQAYVDAERDSWDR